MFFLFVIMRNVLMCRFLNHLESPKRVKNTYIHKFLYMFGLITELLHVSSSINYF